MPPWLINAPTVGGIFCIAAFLFGLFSGRIALGREVVRERQAKEELQILITFQQSATKHLQDTVDRLVLAIEKLSRKRGGD